ncbi:MAG: trimethylamine methyltransferase family protein [Anaerolineae bacterium]
MAQGAVDSKTEPSLRRSRYDFLRDYRQTWFDKGALDINARAHRRMEELVAAYEPLPLGDDIVRELQAIATRHARAAGLDQLPALTG